MYMFTSKSFFNKVADFVPDFIIFFSNSSFPIKKDIFSFIKKIQEKILNSGEHSQLRTKF